MTTFPCTRSNVGSHVLLHLVAGLVAVLALRSDGRSLQAQDQPPLPDRFDSYIKAHVKLTADEYRQLLAGQPVTQSIETEPEKEVASSAPSGQGADRSLRRRREGHRVV